MTHKESPNSFPKGAPQASTPAKAGSCSQHPPAHRVYGPSPGRGGGDSLCKSERAGNTEGDQPLSTPLPGLHPQDWR